MANTIGTFALQEPSAGEMRIFYSGSSGGDRVRAITIRKKSKNDIDITPSLQELNFIQAKISSSGEFSQFDPIVKSDKGTYFFITNTEFIVGTGPNIISQSLNSSVVLDPNLTQTFSNTAFNPLISNATVQRPSRFRFDVDRSSGFVHPSNYEALRGAESINITDFKIKSGSIDSFENIEGIHAPQNAFGNVQDTSFLFTSPATNSLVLEPEDFPINVQVSKQELFNVFGTPTVPNIRFKSGAIPAAEGEYTFKLQINIETFKSQGSGNQLVSLNATNVYEEHYENSIFVSSSFNPINLIIEDSDLNTDDRIHFKALMRIDLISKGNNTNSKDLLIFTNPISHTANTTTKDNLSIRIFKNHGTPFARRADVPDSNYTSTGYANARYNGSKTSANTFGGVSPAFGAKLFKGLALEIPGEFDFAAGSASLDGLYDVIADKAISASADRFEDFFFDTEGKLPIASTDSVGTIASSSAGAFWHATAALTTTADNQFVLNTAGAVDLEIGDVIGFNKASGINAAIDIHKERCIVTNIEPIAATNFIVNKPAVGAINSRVPVLDLKRITVLRAQFGTTASPTSTVDSQTASHGRTVRVFRKRGSSIFNIEGSRAIGASDKIIVLDAENIAANLGSNISSSFDFVLTDERGNVANIFTSASRDGILESET